MKKVRVNVKIKNVNERMTGILYPSTRKVKTIKGIHEMADVEDMKKSEYKTKEVK